MNEKQLRKSLTEQEAQRLNDYEKRERANEILLFATQICDWPPEADALYNRRALQDAARQDKKELTARRDYQAQKEAYQAQLDAALFTPLPEGDPFQMANFNLPGLVARYERERQWRTTPTSRREHADSFSNEIVADQLRARFDPYGEKEGEIKQILDNAVCKLIEGVSSHIAQRPFEEALADEILKPSPTRTAASDPAPVIPTTDVPQLLAPKLKARISSGRSIKSRVRPAKLEASAPQLKAPVAKSGSLTLSPAELILAPGFTLDEADRLAYAVGLTDGAGTYCLGARKLGAVVGFALALQRAGKLTGKIPDLTAVLAPRWGVHVATRKTGTGVAGKYLKLTNKALTLPTKTD